MNGSKIRWWSVLTVLGLTLTLLLAPTSAYAQSISFDQGELASQGQAWWQWALQFKNSESPILDTTGARCASKQSGSVWFLAGTAGDPVTRSCTVPTDKRLLLPLVTVECSDLERGTPFFGGTPAERGRCAANFIAGVGPATLKLTIDGQSWSSADLVKTRAVTRDFPFIIPVSPAGDNFLGVACPPPAPCHGRAVAAGYWALIQPLPRGTHQILAEATFTSGDLVGGQNITYNLTSK
jgi:hypothetical protein